MNKKWFVAAVVLLLMLMSFTSYGQGRFTAKVTVLDDLGKPVGGVPVTIFNPADRRESFSGTTDLRGIAEIKVEVVFRAGLRVRVDKPGFLQGDAQLRKTQFLVFGDSRDKDRDLQIKLEKDISVAEVLVIVVDENGRPVAGTSVTATGSFSTPAYESAETDMNGNTTLYLIPGSYTLDVSSSNFERSPTRITISTGERNRTVPISVKRKKVSTRKNAQFGIAVLGKNEDGKAVPLKGARVSLPDYRNATGVTDEKGITYIDVQAGVGDEVVVEASAPGYKTARKIAKTRAQTIGGGMIIGLEGAATFELERIPSNTINFYVAVFDSGTNEPIEGANVGLELAYTGPITKPTDRQGVAAFEKPATALPAEKARQGFRVKVDKPGYEDRWSDVTPDLLLVDSRRFVVYLKPVAGDARFVGTWKCECKITIILNKDHTASFIDARGGGEGSMSESGTYEAKWSTAFTLDSIFLTLTKGKNPNRLSTMELTLKNGKLTDRWDDVYIK